jgi:hypothetical protein
VPQDPDSHEKIPALISRLEEVNGRLAAWHEALGRETEKAAPQLDRTRPQPLKLVLSVKKQAIANALEKIGEAPRNEAFDFLEELARAYLEASPQDRLAIRNAAGENSKLLHLMREYIARAATFIHSPADVAWLRSGLAVASIEDLRVDFRDDYLVLGNLYLAAAHGAIDPLPYFAQAAEISSREKSIGQTSTHDFLARFHLSAFFAESVRPRLAQPGSKI